MSQSIHVARNRAAQALVAQVLFVSLVVALGCYANGCTLLRPGPGNACTTGQAVCQDDGSGLECINGKYVDMPCKGPAKCSMGAGHVISCDQSVADGEGEICASANEGLTVCGNAGVPDAGPGAYVTCTKGIFKGGTCGPGQSCRSSGGIVTCAQ